MINLTDDSKQAIIDILTDNEEVAFKAEYINQDFQNINYTKGKTQLLLMNTKLSKHFKV